METLENFKKVLALNSKINSTLDLDELLGIIMTTAGEVMRAEAASLMLLDEESKELVFRVALGEKGSELKEKFRVKLGEGIAGWVAQSGEPLIINDPRTDKRFAGRFDDATGFQSKAIICVPMHARDKIIGILEALNPIGRNDFSNEDLVLFQTFADQAAISVENARLHQALVQQELAARELKIAREIQQSFLPDLKTLALPIDLACRNIPAREVSGDFYDIFRLDENRTGVMIGDVSGKGVPASLYMVRAISDSRFLAPRFPDPANLLRELNKRLVRDSRFGIFTTLLYLVVDSREKSISFASAGHHPMLRRKAGSGTAESVDGTSGMPLGLFEEAEYASNTLQAEAGDTFFLYTDGITEARNAAGQEFELGRVKQAVAEAAQSSLEYADRIFDALKEFTRGAEQHDDITLVTVKI